MLPKVFGKCEKECQMSQLNQKIETTTLFSDEDKIAILAAVDDYSEADKKALGDIIDEFDAKHRNAVSEYKTSVQHVLDDIVKKAAPKETKRYQQASYTIRKGIDALFQS